MGNILSKLWTMLAVCALSLNRGVYSKRYKTIKMTTLYQVKKFKDASTGPMVGLGFARSIYPVPVIGNDTGT